MTLEKLQQLSEVWDVRPSKSRWPGRPKHEIWRVEIVRVDADARTVWAKWNGNKVREFDERSWKKWRAKIPLESRKQ
jgi:hypothetical protein